MGFFGDGFFGDDFEKLFNSLTQDDGFTEYNSVGSDSKRKTSRKSFGSTGRLPVKHVAASKKVFFIFDFSGEKDLKVSIGDNLVKDRYGERLYDGKKVLEIKNSTNTIAQYPVPSKLKLKNMESSFNNGILEVSFKK